MTRIDQTVDSLIRMQEEGTLDHDSTISVVLTFVEKVVPRVLAMFKGEAHEAKRKAIATSIRLTIWAIMPFPKFQEYMALEEMKAIDEMAKSYQEKGEVEISEEAYNKLFKSPTEVPRDIYK